MARNKKRKTKKQKPVYPKAIEIVEEDETFKLYKIWSKNKRSSEPFVVSDNLADVVEEYQEKCEKWNIKPDMKTIFKLVNNHKSKEQNNEEADIFKSRYV